MNFPVPVQWLLAFWIANTIFSAAVQALPEPDGTSAKGYRFLFKFLSLLASDFKSFSDVMPKVIPTTSQTTGQLTTVNKPIPAAVAVPLSSAQVNTTSVSSPQSGIL